MKKRKSKSDPPAPGMVPSPPPPGAEDRPEGAGPEAAPAGFDALADLPSPLQAPAPAEGPPAAAAPAPPDSGPASALELSLVAPVAQPAPAPAAEPLLAPLEERIRRLEEALAQLSDLGDLEHRVAERVAEQLTRVTPTPAAPVAAPATSVDTGALLEAGRRLLGAAKAAMPGAPATTAPAAPQAAPAVGSAAGATERARRVWLLWDLVAEARAIVRMYLDPRYQLSWLGRVVPLGLVAAFVLTDSWLPMPNIPILKWLVEKAVELGIGFVLFKVLGYEARRYRETAPDLPPTLRL